MSHSWALGRKESQTHCDFVVSPIKMIVLRISVWWVWRLPRLCYLDLMALAFGLIEMAFNEVDDFFNNGLDDGIHVASRDL
jgi:hypothetical protein